MDAMVRPQSRFLVCWMCRASIIVLLVRVVLTYLAVPDSHFTWSIVPHACPAVPFF